MSIANNYKVTKELAEKLLDIALKYDELDKFIIGYPGYELYVNDGMGQKINSVDAMMKAIYKRYLSDNSISDKLYVAIESRVNSTKNGITLLHLLDIIQYQMRSEKQNVSPFDIDCAMLLQCVKNNIVQNKAVYSRGFKDHKEGFIDEFKNFNQTLETNYGHRIL